MLKQLKATMPKEAKENMRISLPPKKKNINKKHRYFKKKQIEVTE